MFQFMTLTLTAPIHRSAATAVLQTTKKVHKSLANHLAVEAVLVAMVMDSAVEYEVVANQKKT